MAIYQATFESTNLEDSIGGRVFRCVVVVFYLAYQWPHKGCDDTQCFALKSTFSRPLLNGLLRMTKC